MPERISNLVDLMRRDRQSPGPSLDEVKRDEGLLHLPLCVGEPDVEEHAVPAIPGSGFKHIPSSSSSSKAIVQEAREAYGWRQTNALEIDTAAFSVAMSGTKARLYVSWKHDEQQTPSTLHRLPQMGPQHNRLGQRESL
ncbi:hypothetical protein XA68_11961 [Ophiocordyceps unilateralis]|uniref:Uncharacterized protein n=1 Tax=Ophiocordyceps unilateralis TaxID=268505 RepID=A0A2A9PDZ1_OPHUN|nr:hypothetical protein XA68_11961 [Ophiocordyceps unilateralis]